VGGGSPRGCSFESCVGGLGATGRGPRGGIPATMSDPLRGRSVRVGTLFVYSRASRVRSSAWKVYPGENGIEDVTSRARPPLKKCFFVMDEGESELIGEGRSRRVIHSGDDGYEDRVTLKHEDTPPPIAKSVVLSLTVSQRTIHNLTTRLFFLVSLEETLSTRYSRVVGSRVDSVSIVVCAKWCSAHVTRTRSPLAANAVWSSRVPCRMPVWLSRTSIKTKRKASISQALYLGRVSSIGWSGRVVVTQ